MFVYYILLIPFFKFMLNVLLNRQPKKSMKSNFFEDDNY